MATIADSLNPVAATWAGLMLAAVWQTTLLAILIALVASRLQKAAPAVRYWLWQILTFKLLIVSFWTIAIPLPPWLPRDTPNQPSIPPAAVNAPADGTDRGAAIAASPPVQGRTVRRPPPFSDATGLSVASWLMMAWLLVVATEVFLVLHQRTRLARLLCGSRSLDETPLKAQLTELAGQLGLKRVPELREVEFPGSPFVCGLRHPWVVLPASLADSLGPEELRQVLLHELAHVKRGDLFWDWFPTIARMLFFFHPVAHWAARRILLERELACDQLALRLSNQDGAGYARMLVRVASMASFPLRVRTAKDRE